MRYERDHYTSVNEVKEVPTTEHWAVLVNESMSYDDGYGDYGAASRSTLEYTRYIAFDNEEVLKAWILEAESSSPYSKKTYRVLHVTPAIVNKQVTIAVDIAKQA